MTENINILRQQIDGIDEEICSLIQKRKKVSQKIGDYKKLNHLPIKDIRRERKHIQNLQNTFPNIDKNLIKKVIQTIIDDSVKQQSN